MDLSLERWDVSTAAKREAIARRLAKECDVLIEGFRPSVAARLGIGYEDLSRDNPGLIYLSVSAFGQSGPYSKRPGSDSVAESSSNNLFAPHQVFFLSALLSRTKCSVSPSFLAPR